MGGGEGEGGGHLWIAEADEQIAPRVERRGEEEEKLPPPRLHFQRGRRICLALVFFFIFFRFSFSFVRRNLGSTRRVSLVRLRRCLYDSTLRGGPTCQRQGHVGPTSYVARVNEVVAAAAVL